MNDRGPSIVTISAIFIVGILLMAAMRPPQTNTKEFPMQIDIQKLKDECRREMEQEYREGWKAGYKSENLACPPRNDPYRLRGWHDGKAERAKDEAKAREAQ